MLKGFLIIFIGFLLDATVLLLFFESCSLFISIGLEKNIVSLNHFNSNPIS